MAEGMALGRHSDPKGAPSTGGHRLRAVPTSRQRECTTAPHHVGDGFPDSQTRSSARPVRERRPTRAGRRPSRQTVGGADQTQGMRDALTVSYGKRVDSMASYSTPRHRGAANSIHQRQAAPTRATFGVERCQAPVFALYAGHTLARAGLSEPAWCSRNAGYFFFDIAPHPVSRTNARERFRLRSVRELPPELGHLRPMAIPIHSPTPATTSRPTLAEANRPDGFRVLSASGKLGPPTDVARWQWSGSRRWGLDSLTEGRPDHERSCRAFALPHRSGGQPGKRLRVHGTARFDDFHEHALGGPANPYNDT